jgi:hypothetical protein
MLSDLFSRARRPCHRFATDFHPVWQASGNLFLSGLVHSLTFVAMTFSDFYSTHWRSQLPITRAA